MQAHSKNKSGKTREARNYGLLALCWNIAVIIYHVILWIVIIAIIAVYARRGVGGPLESESTCRYVLTQVCYYVAYDLYDPCRYEYVYK